MKDTLGVVRDSKGRIYGQSELVGQIQGWLVHPKVGPVLLQQRVAASPGELVLIHRDLPSLTKRGLAMTILWLTKNAIVRRRLVAVQAVAERRSRREAKESLNALIEWATLAQSKLALN